MEDKNSLQLELFSHPKGSSAQEGSAARGYFLKRIWVYEKSILVVIAILITAVISFSLGVRKGRDLAQAKDNAGFDMAKQPKPAPAGLTSRQETIIEQYPAYDILASNKAAAPQKAAMRTATGSSGYTIQLASYVKKASAQKEAESLKKSGLAPIILSKGKHSVLCVGNFTSKEAARQGLEGFKKQKKYSDSIIRRL